MVCCGNNCREAQAETSSDETRCTCISQYIQEHLSGENLKSKERNSYQHLSGRGRKFKSQERNPYQYLSGGKFISQERTPCPLEHCPQQIIVRLEPQSSKEPRLKENSKYSNRQKKMGHCRCLCTCIIIILLCVIGVLILTVYYIKERTIINTSPFDLDKWKRLTTTVIPDNTQYNKLNILEKLGNLLDAKLDKNKKGIIAELKNIAQTIVNTIVGKIKHELTQLNMNTLAAHEATSKNELISKKTSVKIEQLEKKNQELESELREIRDKLQDNLNRKSDKRLGNGLMIRELKDGGPGIESIRRAMPSELKATNIKLDGLEKKTRDLQNELHKLQIKLENDEKVEIIEDSKNSETEEIGIIPNEKELEEMSSMEKLEWEVQQPEDDWDQKNEEEYQETTDNNIEKIIVHAKQGYAEDSLPGISLIRADKRGNFKYEVKNLIFI